MPTPPEIDALIQEQFKDGIPFRSRSHYIHQTWAKTFSSLPELFIQPESLEEVEKIVNLARICRRRVVTTGCGHSPSSMTCTSNWLVNLDNFNRILDVNVETGEVRMQSGIRLYQLGEELDKRGLAMPNLGSINEQSIAGAISTGTHGSTRLHGLVGEDIRSLKITLASGKTEFCSREENPDLFRAALLSLGALGIITEVTFWAVPAFSLKWSQTINHESKMLEAWNDELWTQSEFVRVWWFPYMRKAVVWEAKPSDDEHYDPPTSYYDSTLGYFVYHNLLYAGLYFPRILPWVEWFVFGMQYGFKNGTTTSGVQPSRKALLLNCLYSQFVNEWAIPLEKGPEAIKRLSTWINNLQPGDPGYMAHGIPVSNEGIYVHSPMEVRVSDTTFGTSPRPFLDGTCEDGPTLFLNATLYRPYLTDPACRERYYDAFEYLMKELGGTPHWAKNFHSSRADIEKLYGKNLLEFRRIRDEVDPEGMFVGPWHRETILEEGKVFALEEKKVEWKKARDGGVMVYGTV